MITEIAVLGALQRRELHGYQLKKELDALVGHLGGLSFGSLYPALRRLERAGAITKLSAERPSATDSSLAAADTGLSGLRALRRAATSAPSERAVVGRRKVFRITDAGRALLLELLAHPSVVDGPEFVLWLAFAGALPAGPRLALLERRRRTLESTLGAVRDGALRFGASDRFGALALDHETARVQAELAWLTDILETEFVRPDPATPDPATQGAV